MLVALQYRAKLNIFDRKQDIFTKILAECKCLYKNLYYQMTEISEVPHRQSLSQPHDLTYISKLGKK